MTSLTDRKNAAISRGVGMTTQVYADARGKTRRSSDKEGNRLHRLCRRHRRGQYRPRHPKVIAAVKAQLDRFTHTCHQVVPYENYVHLAERLNAMCQATSRKRPSSSRTGAEAVENAVKIARAATGRQAVVAFGGGFPRPHLHGHALTGKVVRTRSGFGAMPADVFHAPFPIELHGVTVEQSLSALKKLFAADVDPAVSRRSSSSRFREKAASIGPDRLHEALREICDQHGILLIADEVQTGLPAPASSRHGTSRRRAGSDDDGEEPRRRLPACGRQPAEPRSWTRPGPGGLGGTYGGNPLGIAAAHAVLDVIVEENLCERRTSSATG